jgi:hypothetical protein
MNRPKETKSETPDLVPGRPKESGSRQQTTHAQTSSSGSPAFDHDATRRGNGEQVPAIPPGTK